MKVTKRIYGCVDQVFDTKTQQFISQKFTQSENSDPRFFSEFGHEYRDEISLIDKESGLEAELPIELNQPRTETTP